MSIMKAIVQFLSGRIKERSTWVGLSLLGAGAGIHFDPDNAAKVVETVSELAGLIFILTKDK